MTKYLSSQEVACPLCRLAYWEDGAEPRRRGSRRRRSECGPRATEAAEARLDRTAGANRRRPAGRPRCATRPATPSRSIRIRWSSPGPPSGEDVGRLVVEEPVIELRQQPAGLVVEAAVAGAGGVAGEGAAAHRRRPEVVEAAAAEAAELPVKVLPLTVAVTAELTRPPPKRLAELPVKVLSITVAVPKLPRPPPSWRSCW